MSVLIKDLPIEDRPIERMLRCGVESLSDSEVLAILIKTGTNSMSSKNLADEILKNFSDLNSLNFKKLSSIKGIGVSKAATILCAIELGRRLNQSVKSLNDVKFTNSQIVYDYYKNKLGDKKHEYFYCVYLDNAKKIICDKLLFIGTLNQSLVHPREVFKAAYEFSASSIICVHNHPAGSIFPSREDLELTSKLVDIGKILGIKVIDHIIVTKDNYYSFFENNNIG